MSADYRLPSERRWVLTAPIVSALDVDTPVAVRLQPGDPVKGFIRADEVARTYVLWLTDPMGMITAPTLDALAAALRTEMNLYRRAGSDVLQHYDELIEPLLREAHPARVERGR